MLFFLSHVYKRVDEQLSLHSDNLNYSTLSACNAVKEKRNSSHRTCNGTLLTHIVHFVAVERQLFLNSFNMHLVKEKTNNVFCAVEMVAG